MMRDLDPINDIDLLNTGERVPRRRKGTKAAAIRRVSALEEELALHLRAAGLYAGCEREWRWCPGRRFRADFGFPAQRMMVEVEGGLFMMRGGHNSHSGITRDIEKGNLAAELGITLLRFTREMIQSGEAIRVIERMWKARAQHQTSKIDSTIVVSS